jgi:hypothetical protein
MSPIIVRLPLKTIYALRWAWICFTISTVLSEDAIE